jgi:DNA-binding NtrC family response regulator
LRNVVESMLLLSKDNVLRGCDLPPDIRHHANDGRLAVAHETELMGQHMKLVERRNIETAIRSCGGNLTRAAKQLGIARSTLYLRLAAYEASPAHSM